MNKIPKLLTKTLLKPRKNRTTTTLKSTPKLLSLSLIISLLLSPSALAFFDDVPKDHPHLWAIDTLYEENRLPVEHDNLFRPDEKITTTELYELLISYAKQRTSTEINLPFTDIDENHPHAAYIQTALDLNILKPNKARNPELKPNIQVTKTNALKTFFKALGVGVNHFLDEDEFAIKDLNPNSPIAPLAHKAAQIGIIEDPNPNSFKMAKRITRAEAANYLYQISRNGNTNINAVPTQNITLTSLSKKSKNQPDSFNQHPSYETLLNVWEQIQEKYIDQHKLDEEELVFAAIEGLVDELEDPYSSFSRPDQAQALLNNISGEFEGIGIVVDVIDGQTRVVSPLKDSPAEEAGLKSNDIILEVEGQNINGWALENTIKLIKGPAGSKVKLKILRNRQEINLTVTRELIVLPSIEHTTRSENNKLIGIISINHFAENTAEEFEAAAKEVLAKGNIKGLVIDLRNNPGGYLDVASNIAGNFTAENTEILTTQLKDNSGRTQKIYANGNGLLSDIDKIALIINAGSASASEILAGALQDNNIARIFGETSFGKGTVQELTNYKDGSLFKLTVAEWLTSNGNKIDGLGITPDTVTKNSSTSSGSGTRDLQLDAALDYLAR